MNNIMHKALIVDDEILAQDDLHAIIMKINNIEVIGKARNLAEARKIILEKKPDLIFLDIEMPSENGFELIDEISKNIHVVFVTAFNDYAIKAFEVDALDYLLKPVTLERLKSTIERIDSIEPIEDEASKLNYEDKIFIQLNKTYQFLPLSEILIIEADDYYSKIYTKDKKKNLVSKSLKKWESRLPDNHFQRIHRSFIVNINEVEKVLPWFNNSYRVYLKGIEEPFALSRRYFSKIKKMLG